MRRRLLTILAAGAVALALLVPPASAQPADGGGSRAGVQGSLGEIPSVTGPVPVTGTSYPFSSMRHHLAPVDPAAHGYVEEEYFLSGTANVYATDSGGGLSVTRPDVPYTNRILVRRPADSAEASGVVLVDILNASNGYDIEDHWRRMDQWVMDEGHTYVGVTSKPLSVDALKLFDPDRYAPLSWDVDPSIPRDPVAATPGEPFDSFQVVAGAEEGLVWDILGQLGALLGGDAAGRVLGGGEADTVLLMGQSQSGIYLNTWVNRFHAAAAQAGAGYDGYLSTGAAYWERPLSQDPDCAGRAYQSPLCLLEPREGAVDVPFISLSAEADLQLFGTTAHQRRELPAGRTVWHVPGTLHSDPTSRAVPTNTDLARAKRNPRTVPTGDAAAAVNTFPLDPAAIAAAQALIDADQRGLAVPSSQWFDLRTGTLARDRDGNGLGGIRYGLIVEPLGTYAGGLDLMSAAEFRQRYGTRAEYLRRMQGWDAAFVDARYLTPFGARELTAVAETFLDRILGPPTAAPAPRYGFFLNDGWSTTANHAFMFGRFTDQVLVGDWDGDGTDSLAVRRGATYYLSNAPRGGAADTVLTYGRPDDTVLVGDWDGDGTDTLAVRRGAAYHVRNALTSGPAERVVAYGRAEDAVVVGDWDGDGRDTLAVRRGAEYFVKNTIGAGAADTVVRYGRPGDVTLAGDWDGDGRDTFAVRRGATYYVKNTVAPGNADRELVYGRAGDEVLVGDWDGDGTDTLGVRRAP